MSSSPTSHSSLSDHPSGAGNSLNQTIHTIFSSYNSNIFLAAIISLLLVILFVLLLHVYAKWFLAHARRRRRRSSISVTHILGPNRLHHFNFESSHGTIDTDNGLDAGVIAAIPLFVFGSGEKVSPECVICLGGYEEGDVGRKLRKCGHEFHVECIDMWLRSHSSCPICRAPVVAPIDEKINGGDDDDGGEIVIVIDDRDRDRDDEVSDSDSESVASAVASSACCSCSCASHSPAPPTATMALGGSGKRMVKSERRVHPS